MPRFGLAEDVEREVQAHLAMRAEEQEQEQEGWDPVAAREEARRLFGDKEAVAAMGMVVGGLLMGMVAALVMTRAMRGFLYEVSPNDPVALVGSVLALFGAAFLASWLPARAGIKVDPMVTMRAE